MWNWREVVGPHHVARQRDRLPRHTHVLQHSQHHHTERIRSAILTMMEIAEVQHRRLRRLLNILVTNQLVNRVVVIVRGVGCFNLYSSG